MSFFAVGAAAVTIGGTVTSAISASAQKKAAKTAANAQITAAQIASDEERAQYEQTRLDLQPYRNVGYQALSDLRALSVEPLTYGEYDAPAAYQPEAAYTGPTEAELRADPGYAFRVREGQRVLEQSAAARGLTQSGGQLRALTRYGQDVGAQEYANVYARGRQRNLDTYARGLQQNQDVYNRGLQEYNTNYNVLTGLRRQNTGELQALAGAGQGAVNTLAAAGAQTAQQIGANTIGAGNAQAAGAVGAANATSAGLSNVASAIGQGISNYQTLAAMRTANLGYSGGYGTGAAGYGGAASGAYTAPQTQQYYYP